MTKADRKLIVHDTAGNLYYTTFGKEEFEVYPDMRTVEVYNSITMETKRFIKKFLTIKEVLQVEKKNERPKRVYEKKPDGK